MDDIPPSADAELAMLADVVWTQRTAMEQLAFHLVALKLVLAADLRRYVGRCVDQVDAASDRLERIDDRRVAALDALAVACGRRPDSLPLGVLARVAPEPWATVFAEHHDHLRVLVIEIDHARVETARLCATTLDELAEDLSAADVAGRRALAGEAPVSRTPLRLLSSVDAGGDP